MSSRKLGSIACMLVALAGLDVARAAGRVQSAGYHRSLRALREYLRPRTEAQQKDPTIPPPNPPPPLKPGAPEAVAGA